MAIGDDYQPRAKPPEVSDAVRRQWAAAEKRFKDESEVREYLVGTGRYGEVEVGRMTPTQLNEALRSYSENLLLGTDSAVRSEHTAGWIKGVKDIEDEVEVRQYLVGTGRFGEAEVARMTTEQVQATLRNYADNLVAGNDSAVRSDFRAHVDKRVTEAQDEAEIRDFLVGTGAVTASDAALMTRDDLQDALVDYGEQARAADGGDSRSFDPDYWVGPADIGVAPVDVGVAPTEAGMGSKGGTGTVTSPGGGGNGDRAADDGYEPADTTGEDPVGEDPFVVPGSTPSDDTERGDEGEGAGVPGDTAEEPQEEAPAEETPEPEDDEAPADDGGGGGGTEPADDEEDSGYTGPPTSFDAGEEEGYSQTDEEGNELSDEEAFGSDDPPPEDSGGDDDDDDDDDDGESGEAGGGAGTVLQPGDSDARFNQTGLRAMQERLAQGIPTITRNGGDIDPADDDFGSGAPTEGTPVRRVPGVVDPADPEDRRPVSLGNGPLTRNDGVTDPAQDDDTGGAMGPESDPLAGGNPPVEEEAPDEPAEDEDADGAPALGSRVRSRLEEAIDDGRIDVDDVEPDGHLMVDPG